MAKNKEKPDDSAGYYGNMKTLEDIKVSFASLTNALKETEEYSVYSRALNEINNNNELKDKINRLKTLNLEIQTKMSKGTAIDISEEKELSNLYMQLTLNDTANDFLRLEKEFAVLLRGEFLKIIEGIELDIAFYI